MNTKLSIHTGDNQERPLLTSCYLQSLAQAREVGAKTVAFPAISCGIYGFPIRKAAGIAISAVIEDCATQGEIDEVIFVCFSEADAAVYRREFTKRGLAD